jgi:predicted ATPase/Tfp pilus assembly protein PilF
MQALNYLLERASRLSILATSRERLRLRAEHVFELHGMPVPDQGAPTGVQASAVRLFAQHAEQLSNRFKLDDETLPAVLTICRLVEGMPLAIELAAGRIRSATCAQIAEQIAQNLDALASDLRDVAPRHRSARAVFDYSWRLLSEAERGALMRLAVFAGGCTTAAAQAVGAISAELLAALAEKSLVRMAGDQRYDLHELLRQFALEQLMQAPAAQNAWAQHARYYLRLIQDSAGALVGSAPQHTIAALHPERDNLRQAWLRAIELELFESLEAASVGMARWYAHTGNLREGVLAFDAALLPLSSQATPALRALATQLLGEQSELYNRQGMYEESRQYAERALQAAEQLGRGELIALACYRYGEALSGIGAYGEVGPYLERALALARQAGLAEWEPVILRHLGILAINQGAIEQSRQHYKEALAGFRALGNLRGEADVLNNLGVLLAERGDVARARPYYEQSIELQRAIGNLIGEASVLNNLANLGMSMGRYEEICRLFERALALHRSISDQQGEAIVLLNLGDTYRMVGDQPRAEALLSQALAIWQANSNLIDQAIANTALSQLSLDRRDHLAALAHIEEALRITRWLDAPPQHAETLTVAGRVYLQTERYDQAIAALQTAIAEREQAAQTDWALEAYSVLAQVLARSGQTEQAIGIMTERLLPRLRAGAPHINEPLAVYWACFEVLQATADPRAAWVLSQASALLGDWAAQISDPELRASFLAQPTNRAIQSAHAAGD